MFASLVVHRGKVNPDVVAVVGPRGEATFKLLSDRIEQTGDALRQLLGPAPQRIIVDVADPFQHWVVLLALNQLGHISASVPPTPEMLRGVEAQAVLTDRPSVPVLSVPVHALPKEWWQAVLHRPFSGRKIAAAEWEAPARIVVSSGTTGRPKPVQLTNSDILKRIEAGLLAQNGSGLGPATRLLVTMGTGSIGGFLAPLLAWAVGGAVITGGKETQSLLDVLREQRVTSVVVATGQLKQLVASLPPDFTPLAELNLFVGGSLLTASLAKSAREKLTPNLQVAYGSTEAGAVCSAPVQLIDTESQEVGIVYPWVRVEIVDEAGHPLPPGNVGEVRISGPTVVIPASRNLTAPATSTVGSWFYPGDIGSLSEENVLRILGRKTEVLNLGGAKVAPEFIEEILREQAGISDVAAFGATGPEGDTEAFVALVRGQGFDQNRIHAVAKQKLRIPRLFAVYVDTLPRNEMGKIQRNLLKEMVSSELPLLHIIRLDLHVPKQAR